MSNYNFGTTPDDRKYCACGGMAALPPHEASLTVQPFTGFKLSRYAMCEKCMLRLLEALKALGIEWPGVA